MNVLLVNPPIPSTPRAVLDVPLGLGYIGAVLEAQGHQVSAIDMAVATDPWGALTEALGRNCPEVVGITSVACTFDSAKLIARLCKAQHPEIITVIGGVHVTLTGEQLGLHMYGVFDFVVFGEGEMTFAELVNVIEQKGTPSHVAGIGIVGKNHIDRTPPRPFLADLDALPLPARHLFPVHEYRQAQVISTRGCPFQCLFCSSRDFWQGRIRFRSPEKFLDEIEQVLSMYENRKIFVADDTFTLNRDRVMQIAELIQERRLHFRWSCLTRVDLVSKDVLRAMSRAGCETISYGCEVGTQDELDRLEKGITIQQMKEAIQLTKEAGIATRTSWIFGFPWSTKETIEDTVDLIKEILPDEVVIYTPVPYPGTKLFDSIGRYGVDLSSIRDLQFFTGQAEPLVASSNMPTELIRELIARAITELYGLGYKRPEEATSSDKIVTAVFSPVHSFESK